jgi:rare lipoprotein A
VRSIRFFALVTWVLIASLAVAGFATFSPSSPPAAVSRAGVETAAVALPVNGGEAVGRIAALALTNGLTDPPDGLDGVAAASPYAPLFESLGPDGSTTSSSAPPPPPRPRVIVTTPAPAPAAAPAPAYTTTTAAPPPAANTIGPCSASWYGEAFRGRPTASGEPFNPDDFTAAHRSLPLGTVVTVTRVSSGATVKVRINDRGPFVGDRCIDLSMAAMGALGGLNAGVITVVISY